MLSFSGENGKVCSGNGKCKGSGTRKGNGACACDSGFVGETCNQCAHNYFLSYQDEEKTLCSPCHHSCNGDCSGSGPKVVYIRLERKWCRGHSSF